MYGEFHEEAIKKEKRHRILETHIGGVETAMVFKSSVKRF